MTSPGIRALALLLAVGVAAAATGCGDEDLQARTGPGKVDTATVEQAIDAQLTTADAEVDSVKCPDELQYEPGLTFKCSISWDTGATGKVRVTDTGAGHYVYEPVPGTVKIPGEDLARSVEDSFATAGFPNADATCPETVVVKADSPVTCDVVGAPGASGQVTFTVSAVDGSVDPSSVTTA
jgi:hypothetical protein